MNKLIRAAALFLLLSWTQTTFAITPLVLNDNAQFDIPKIFKSFVVNPTYRIGDEWGKKPVTEADLAANSHFRRIALATARVGGATGFFLGEYKGKLIMATNHHVCPTESACLGSAARFPILAGQAKIIDFYGTWTDVDLALFEIQVENADLRKALLEVASPFQFNSQLARGQKLLTIGFGVGDNPRRTIVANQDNDCLVFSDTDEFRFMADPDDLNPGPYKAWSFANGCDVSHGDSGSAMVDRESGKVIGIIWTGRIPKSEKVQNSAYLKNLLQNPNEDIWKELSYGVPASKMKEHLLEQIEKGTIQAKHVEIIRSLLQ